LCCFCLFLLCLSFWNLNLCILCKIIAVAKWRTIIFNCWLLNCLSYLSCIAISWSWINLVDWSDISRNKLSSCIWSRIGRNCNSKVVAGLNRLYLSICISANCRSRYFSLCGLRLSGRWISMNTWSVEAKQSESNKQNPREIH
jgi:hypothetical protein